MEVGDIGLRPGVLGDYVSVSLGKTVMRTGRDAPGTARS